MEPTRIARATLRAEIEELVVENAYLLDRGRFREILDTYAEDCEVTRPLPPFTDPALEETVRGRDAVAAQYADRAMWPPTPRTMRHVVTNLRFSTLEEDRAAATVAWTGYRFEGAGLSIANPMAVGDYEDAYRRDRDGCWRIARRKIVIAFLDRQLLGIAQEATHGNR
ncbi:MAG: nuclear transport factor 2 family protein [Candidatus Binatia bacterium]